MAPGWGLATGKFALRHSDGAIIRSGVLGMVCSGVCRPVWTFFLPITRSVEERFKQWIASSPSGRGREEELVFTLLCGEKKWEHEDTEDQSRIAS